LTDSTPVDKINFIRAYAKAHKVGITKKNILSDWRVTGNWPISRAKALWHPEIQNDKKDNRVEVTPKPIPSSTLEITLKSSRQIRNLSKHKTPRTRRRYAVIAKGFKA